MNPLLNPLMVQSLRLYHFYCPNELIYRMLQRWDLWIWCFRLSFRCYRLKNSYRFTCKNDSSGCSWYHFYRSDYWFGGIGLDNRCTWYESVCVGYMNLNVSNSTRLKLKWNGKIMGKTIKETILRMDMILAYTLVTLRMNSFH